MRVIVLLVLVARWVEGRGVVGPPPPLGAPDTFTLFHPVLGADRAASRAAAADTDRTVPVLHLTHHDKDGEKVLSPGYLGSLQRRLSDSKSKVKPIDVKIIEHEDFIDYEIEFSDLNDSDDSLAFFGPDTEAVAEASNRIHPRRVDQPPPHLNSNAAATPSPHPNNNAGPLETSTQRLPTTLAGVELATGVLLEMLEKARKRQRATTAAVDRSRGQNISTTGPTVFRRRSKASASPGSTHQYLDLVSADNRPRKRVPTRGVLAPKSRNSFSEDPPSKALKMAQRLTKMGRSTTGKPLEPTKAPRLDRLYTPLDNDVDTEDVIVVTRNVTSTRLVTQSANQLRTTTTMMMYELTTPPSTATASSTTPTTSATSSWEQTPASVPARAFSTTTTTAAESEETTTFFSLATTSEPEAETEPVTQTEQWMVEEYSTQVPYKRSTLDAQPSRRQMMAEDQTTPLSNEVLHEQTEVIGEEASIQLAAQEQDERSIGQQSTEPPSIQGQAERAEPSSEQLHVSEQQHAEANVGQWQTELQQEQTEMPTSVEEETEPIDQSSNEFASTLPPAAIIRADDLIPSESRRLFEDVQLTTTVSDWAAFTTPLPTISTPIIQLQAHLSAQNRVISMEDAVLSAAAADRRTATTAAVDQSTAATADRLTATTAADDQPTVATTIRSSEELIYIVRTPRNSELELPEVNPAAVSVDLEETDRSSGSHILVGDIFSGLESDSNVGRTDKSAVVSPAESVTIDPPVSMAVSATDSVPASSKPPLAVSLSEAVSAEPLLMPAASATETVGEDTTAGPLMASHSRSEAEVPVITGPQEEEEEEELEDNVARITEVPVFTWERMPRIIAGGAASNQLRTANKFHDYEEPTTADWFDGQYYEQNPGQYHEQNPGQYHEQNPGQYHEENPGQYHEQNPGQYQEEEGHQLTNGQDQAGGGQDQVGGGQDQVGGGQDQVGGGQDQVGGGQGLVDLDDLTVDFNHKDETKIYNVQAKAGEFIIGEVGKINVNSGQTLEGVRYTAVDGFLDKGKISEILLRFFGTQTLSG